MIQDLLADARVFAQAGVGFGQQECYLLQKALQKLAQEQSASYIRFFGKIKGTQSDYYVVEATAEGGDAEGGEEGAEEGVEKDPEQEDKGTGVNKYTYFVATGCFSKWQKLPDLSPAKIAAARKIKVLFTGDLERDIITNPFFFGKEKHFLRAQIARIAHSTMLAPKGQHKLNEENDRDIEEVVPDEETKAEPLPSTLKAASLDAWVHVNPSILNCCRTLHLDAPEEAPEGFEGEFDPEQAKKEIEAADPFEPRLKPISDDTILKLPGKTVQAPWVLRLEGDSTEYREEQTGKAVYHGVVVIRSLVWPGAITLYANGKQWSIYVGDGHKRCDRVKAFPLEPPRMNADEEEYGEFILPEVKNLSPEELKEAVSKLVDELWADKDSGSLDDMKTLAAEVKAKMTGAESAEIAEDALEDVFNVASRDDDGNVSREEAKSVLATAYKQL